LKQYKYALALTFIILLMAVMGCSTNDNKAKAIFSQKQFEQLVEKLNQEINIPNMTNITKLQDYTVVVVDKNIGWGKEDKTTFEDGTNPTQYELTFKNSQVVSKVLIIYTKADLNKDLIFAKTNLSDKFGIIEKEKADFHGPIVYQVCFAYHNILFMVESFSTEDNLNEEEKIRLLVETNKSLINSLQTYLNNNYQSNV